MRIRAALVVVVVTAVLSLAACASLVRHADVLCVVNAYRERHKAPPLLANADLAAYATELAGVLVYSDLDSDALRIGAQPPYGVNTAGFWPVNPDGLNATDLAIRAVRMWYEDGMAVYDFARATYVPEAAHLTQLIWRDSVLAGVGVAMNAYTGTVVVVLLADPPGNFRGEFAENVRPPVPTPIVMPGPPIRARTRRAGSGWQ